MSVQFSPDGTKIVSGSSDKTIKVWDAGANWASNRPSLAKTDACWLAWQLRWISRPRKRTRIATMSVLFSSRPTDRKSCLDRGTRRSKSGNQVCQSLKIASLRPNLTRPAFPGRHAGACEREDERPQQFDLLRPVLARCIKDCLWIVR